MKLTYELGAEVIQRLKPYLDVPINLMDTKGKIVASTDPSRIDHIHSGAIQVVSEHKELILYENDLSAYPGTRPGVNIPIYLFDEIVGVVGITGDPDLVFKAANITKAAVEIALEQNYIQRQTVFQESALHNWLLQVLHPLGMDQEKLEQEARHMLKMGVAGPVTITVCEIRDAKPYVNEIKERLTSSIKPTFISAMSDDEVVIGMEVSIEVIKSVCLKQFDDFPEMRMGIGSQEIGLEGLRASYFQAKQAIQLSRRQDGPKISHIDEWQLERLIDHIPEHTKSMVFQAYEPRLMKMEDSYMETVQVFFEANMEIKETAERLHIHRNTLMYRLDQIHEKVGLNPRVFRGAMLLYILCFNIRTKD